MEEAQTQEPAVEQAPAQEAVTETVQEAPVQETQPEAPVQEAPAPETPPPFEIFNNPQDLAASMQREAVEGEPVEQVVEQEQVASQPEYVPQEDRQIQPEPYQQQRYSQQDVEGAVLGFLSERLGRQFSSLDELAQPQYDQTLAPIAKFVQETGRRPEDWFRYQSLNTSEMDDMTAVRIHTASEHPNLSGEELNLLVNRKYRVSSEASEEDKRMAQLQLKMDAAKARETIESFRSGYMSPKQVEAPVVDEQPLVDERWVSEMAYNVDAMSGIEFDLGGEKSFTFGLDDQYKQELKYKNANLENFFDPYVNDAGDWDYDLLSSHRAVIDNIDKIVSSAYRQGMSDGQRGVVNTAANVQAKTTDDVSGQQNSNPLGEQVRQILNQNRSTLTFNI
jgi:hypothetical protein